MVLIAPHKRTPREVSRGCGGSSTQHFVGGSGTTGWTETVAPQGKQASGGAGKVRQHRRPSYPAQADLAQGSHGSYSSRSCTRYRIRQLPSPRADPHPRDHQRRCRCPQQIVGPTAGSFPTNGGRRGKRPSPGLWPKLLACRVKKSERGAKRNETKQQLETAVKKGWVDDHASPPRDGETQESAGQSPGQIWGEPWYHPRAT